MSENFLMTEELGLVRLIYSHISRTFHPEITDLSKTGGKGNALAISDISGKKPALGCNIFSNNAQWDK